MIESYVEEKQLELILISKTLALRIGARVMLLRNLDVGAGLVNGSMRRVTKFEDGYPVVAFDNGQCRKIMQEQIEIRANGVVIAARTQVPLRLVIDTFPVIIS